VHHDVKQRKEGAMSNKLLIVLLVLAIAAAAPGCAPGPGSKYDAGHPAGFFSGLRHGLLSPLFFVNGIFTRSVQLYETFNTGTFYNLGFLIGISITFGGAGRKSK